MGSGINAAPDQQPLDNNENATATEQRSLAENQTESNLAKAVQYITHQLDRIDIFENYLDDILTSSSAAIDYLMNGWDKKEEE